MHFVKDLCFVCGRGWVVLLWAWSTKRTHCRYFDSAICPSLEYCSATNAAPTSPSPWRFLMPLPCHRAYAYSSFSNCFAAAVALMHATCCCCCCCHTLSAIRFAIILCRFYALPLPVTRALRALCAAACHTEFALSF